MKKTIAVITVIIGVVIGSASVYAKESEDKSFWDKTSFHGTLGTSYNYNFNRPNPVAANSNVMRVFDDQANTFYINLAELQIENHPTDWAELRVDIALGQDVQVFCSVGLCSNVIDLWQAYGALTAPVGNGLTFKVGKWATLIGAEVIESADNYNTSRSMLFGFAIPFNHLGLLITYPFNDIFSASVGIVNGWDMVRDVNKAKTFIGQLAFTFTENLSLNIQGTVGPEQANSDGNIRGLLDAVLTWAPTDNLIFVLNYDLGKEQGSLNANGFANWQGASLIAHYRFTDLFGLSLRGEFFDDDGSRNNAGLTDVVFAEGTLTGQFYITDGWEARLEFRHDQSDKNAYISNSGGRKKYQDTVSAELVYRF